MPAKEVRPRYLSYLFFLPTKLGIIVVTTIVLTHLLRPSSAERTPENIRNAAKNVLSLDKEQLLKLVDKIRLCNFDSTLIYYPSNAGHKMAQLIDGRLVDALPKYRSLFESIRNDDKFYNLEIYCDSVLIRFSSQDFDYDLVPYICYSECGFDKLRNYMYGMVVFSKDEIPNKGSAYFWEIEDNWFVYVPKEIPHKEYQHQYDYDWAVKNKTNYYHKEYDTLKLLLTELRRLKFGGDSVDISNTTGWFEAVYPRKRQREYLFKKGALLDSVFKEGCPFAIFMRPQYIEFDPYENNFLKYYYSEISKDSLEKELGKKVSKLESNWFYSLEE